MTQPLWSPTNTKDLNITKLQEFVGIENYDQLHDWSIEHMDEFWKYVFTDSNIQGQMGSVAVQGSGFFGTEFFPEAKLNVVNTLLQGDDDQVIITAITEAGIRRQYTRQEVKRSAAKAAQGFLALGVQPGDTVAAWVPNLAEVVIYALGALSIGAVVSTASPDFGPVGVLERFAQIEPKVLLAAASYQYNGKDHNCLSRLPEIVAGLPTLKKVLLIGANVDEYENFENWLSKQNNTELNPIELGFNHPGFVLFSSGTTGKPKCIVHSAAGVMIKVLSEQRYSLDIKPKDQVFYYTTCGWMMWNWLFMALATGAGIVLYDGNPVHPNPNRLFDLAQEEELTFFGVSAKYIDSLRKLDVSPKKTHDLARLKTITSTGSPLSPEGFSYVYSDIKPDLHLASMSGGTDICGCFVIGTPNKPVFAGEIQVPALGMHTTVFTMAGQPAEINEKGELVCLNSFPSRPLYFWGDKDNQKFKTAYFERFEDVWAHGDFAAITEHGGYVIYGRSDATLNSGGVRIGTAEIYRIVEEFDEVLECLAVAQEWQDDTRVLLFVKLKDQMLLDDELIRDIKQALKIKSSPRHVPSKVIQAPELPRTKSNKLVEMAVTEVINGRVVKNVEALANPEALEWFKKIEI